MAPSRCPSTGVPENQSPPPYAMKFTEDTLSSVGALPARSRTSTFTVGVGPANLRLPSRIGLRIGFPVTVVLLKFRGLPAGVDVAGRGAAWAAWTVPAERAAMAPNATAA